MAISDSYRPLTWLLAGAMLVLTTACTPTGDPPALGGNRSQFNDGSDGSENSDLGREAPSLAAHEAEQILGEDVAAAAPQYGDDAIAVEELPLKTAASDMATTVTVVTASGNLRTLAITDGQIEATGRPLSILPPRYQSPAFAASASLQTAGE